MYSQHEEESFIVDYFNGYVGKFIDVGAYDVFRLSNTRRLYELGWTGVLVEPAPENYKGIAAYYEGDSRIQVLNFALGETNGEIDFYESGGDAVSTSDQSHMDKWGEAGVKYTKIKVRQVSVKDFMSLYGREVDFLSIDTEATNIIVFRNTPDFVFERLKMLCIEHDENQREIEERLLLFGFTTMHMNAENIILAK